jgi:hypothetical protein
MLSLRHAVLAATLLATASWILVAPFADADTGLDPGPAPPEAVANNPLLNDPLDALDTAGAYRARHLGESVPAWSVTGADNAADAELLQRPDTGGE